MPLQTGTDPGTKRRWWRYGNSGKKYYGPDAKKEALKQWVAMKYNGYKGKP